jgi:DNA-binding transcriptional LysR family regulator
MDWNGFKVFIAISQYKNLQEAAKSLGMSHTTVYRRLNDFEGEVGRLFERLNGRYELTELGEELMIQAERINIAVEDIERNIAGKDMQPKGIVKITAPNSFAYHDLPTHINELSLLYPDIQLELLVTHHELNMTNRQADIAIRVTQSPPEFLIGHEVRRIQWGVYASQDYVLKYGEFTESKGFDNHRFIGATGALASHPSFVWLEHKHSSKVGPRTDDLVAMSSLALKGNWLAILPDDLMREGLVRQCTFSPVKENQLWILTHPDLRKVQRVKVVMRYLSKALSTVSPIN